MRGWKKYMETEIKTSNPGKVTILAYEKTILALKKAKKHMEEKEYEEASEKLTKVHTVINELGNQINHEAYPELGAELERLYYWVTTEVQIANASKNPEKIDSIITVLANILEGYRGAVENEEK